MEKLFLTSPLPQAKCHRANVLPPQRLPPYRNSIRPKSNCLYGRHLHRRDRQLLVMSLEPNQDYEDRRFKDPAGLAFRASFNWTPSRLTLIVPTIERSVQETTLLGASSMVRTSASLLVRHEYARNILLTGFGGVYHDDFKGLNRDSLLYELRGRVTYAFNENVFISGELAHRKKDSELTNRSFDQNFIGLRLGLQM